MRRRSRKPRNARGGVVVRSRDGLHNSRVWCATRHYAGISVTRSWDTEYLRAWLEMRDADAFATRSRYQMLSSGSGALHKSREFFARSRESWKRIVSNFYRGKKMHHLSAGPMKLSSVSVLIKYTKCTVSSAIAFARIFQNVNLFPFQF